MPYPESTATFIGPPLPPAAPPMEESMLEFCCGCGPDIGELHIEFCTVVLAGTAVAFLLFAIENIRNGRSRRRWARSRHAEIKIGELPD